MLDERVNTGSSIRQPETGSLAGADGALSDFSKLVSLLARVYPGRDFSEIEKAAPLGDKVERISALKRACEQPIVSLASNATREDVSFAGSIFLARKILPPTTDKAQLLEGYISKMGRDQSPNARFVAFCEVELARLFPAGWDSAYVKYCSAALPTSGASFGTASKNGGAREELKSKYVRSEFVTACATGQGIKINPDRRVEVIDDNGKLRIVTVADANQHVLKPLHHLMYDHLSRRKWLLRGEATANSFKGFERVRGEVFVSGDYESATDNFNRYHSEAILTAMRSTSRSIPDAIWEIAFQSLSGRIVVDGVAHPQVAGQLMGNLLSFPLLCLTNYLALRYAIPRHIPLRINGDDIVFRCTLAEAQYWMKVVREAGLTLSMGKTLVHERFFSLNSAFFEAKFPRGLRPGDAADKKLTLRVPSLIPVVRAKAIYRPLARGDCEAARDRLLRSCKGFDGRRKGMVRGHMLRYHRKTMRDVACSFNRALGVKMNHEALVEGNLLEQEYFYLGLPAALDKPRRSTDEPGAIGKPLHASSGWKKVPRRWVKDPVVRENLEDRWGEHCVEYAWHVREVRNEAEIRSKPLISPPGPGPDPRKSARLLHTSVRGLQRWRSAAARKIPMVKKLVYDMGYWRSRRPETIWVPESEVAHYRPQTVFVHGANTTEQLPTSNKE
jgi:hypothetical protein